MLAKGIVGVQSLADAAQKEVRIGKTAALISAAGHGRYFEPTLRGKRFYAANQAAQAVSVALATTYTGICLSNPAGSTVDLVVDKVGFALSVAPAAIASIGLISGYAAAGVVTHTAALAPQGCYLGNVAGQGLADSQCTIVGTPRWMTMLYNGFTAAALPGGNFIAYDAEGSIVIPPGGYVAIGALTAVTGFGSISWEEVPR